MIPFYNLPDKQEYNQIFYCNHTVNWQVWKKPQNAKNVFILCIGGGGGGASGVGGSNTSRSGGASGAASPYSLGTFLACMLPDNLFSRVGAGGAGGDETTTSTQNNGADGQISYISVVPNTPTDQNTLIQSSSTTSKGAITLTGGVTGAGMNLLTGNHLLYTLGLILSESGYSGKNSGPGTGTNSDVTSIVSAGASGGGVSSGVASSGGSINASGFFTGVSGGTASGTGGSINGSNGWNVLPSATSPRSFALFTGGAGGGGINSGVGGTGGYGGFGCG